MGTKPSMLPGESPSQFVAPEAVKRNIRTVKNLALYMGIGTVAVAVGFLSFEAASRTPASAQESKDKLTFKGRPVGSRPPNDLDSKRTTSAAGGAASTRTSPVSALNDQVKADQEFEGQIRQEQHRRALAKMTLAGAAETSDIGVDLSRQGHTASATDAASDGIPPASRGQIPPSSGGASPSLAGGLGRNLPGELTGGLTDPNMQGRKEAFAEKEGLSGYLSTRKQVQVSPYEVKQGTVIPGIMISGINSDLPGQIIAQVSQNVYDSATGKYLLIPQGTRLVGTYDSFVAIGQERAMVAWHRIQFPDGASLDILNMPGADEGGYGGFNDQVNNHYMKIFGSAIMLSLVGTGYQLSQPQQHVGDPLSAQSVLAAQVGQQLAQVSGELMRRNMQIQPTIEIRPGYRFNIMVNKDMILEPYTEAAP